MSEPHSFVAEHDSPEHALVVHLCEMFRMAVAATCPDEDAAPKFNSIAMTAACMFAGSLFGTMLYAGLARPQDKRRVTEAMMRNFRSGIDVGLRRGARVEKEMGGSGQA